MSKNLKLKKVIKNFVPEPISYISGFLMYISRILVVSLDMALCYIYYLVLEAKACRSWHDFESGSTRSGKRPRNIGINFEWLVQVMEGERENAKESTGKEEKKLNSKNKKKKCGTPRARKKKKRKLNSENKKKKMLHPKQEKEGKKKKKENSTLKTSSKVKRKEPDTSRKTKKKKV